MMADRMIDHISRKPGEHGVDSAPGSAGPERRASVQMRAPVANAGEARGCVFRIVRWMDANKGAFLISRLILQTGIKLRTFHPDSPDDPRVLAKLWPAVDALLTPEEREALLRSLQDS
jgi:hypothetical protein